MSEVYVGIDLGLSGAISILREDGSIKVIDIPTREVSFMKNDKPKIRREIEEPELLKILFAELTNETGTIHICMERVSSRPKEGTTSAFRFGEVTGTVKTAVVALKVLSGLDVKWYKVFPSVWKRTFDLIGTDKTASLELARTKYPALAKTFLKRKKDHNRGDAILLAEYIKNNKPSSTTEDDAEDE